MLMGFQNNACIAPHLSKEKVVHKTKITSSEKKKNHIKDSSFSYTTQMDGHITKWGSKLDFKF